MKIMALFNLLTMVGGLALFLFGMYLMGEGLKKVSGGRMEAFLERLTANKLAAVILGAGVTAVIQSSSATTVMVVGFVNAGIMKLEQTVGVIMGANIGTTITSWLLSLTGIQGDSLLISLLKPSSFSPVLAIVGVALLLFSKAELKKDIGTIPLGFAILMFGMERMSEAVEPLAGVPEFAEIMTKFSNPILGMLAGTLLTAIIQSSSASIGILQALSTTGTVSYGVAIPIIMGQNIGTCITAMLAGIGTTRNAKRASLIHLYFNLIGTCLYMLVFYTLNTFIQFRFLNHAVNEVGIAVIHSAFNIGVTIVLLPFTKWLVKLSRLTILDNQKEETESERYMKLLDVRFLEKPAYAVAQAKAAADCMLETVCEAVRYSFYLLAAYKKTGCKKEKELAAGIGSDSRKMSSYLMQVSCKPLLYKDNQTVNIILQSICDMERIAAHTRGIAETAKKMNAQKAVFSKPAKEEIKRLLEISEELLEDINSAFAAYDCEKAQAAMLLGQQIKEVIQNLKKSHIKRLRKGKCTIELGVFYLDILADCEGIAAHCVNMAGYIKTVRDRKVLS